MKTRRQGLGSLAVRFAGLVFGAALVALPWRGAEAQIGSARYSAIVIEARTGSVLIDAGADEPRFPASLTKMMTLYMVFEALRDGRTQLGSRIVMSEEAASRPPSKLGIPAGGGLTVEQAILALVTKSANDVAAAVGEHLAGSEERFAQMMTMRARSLGMTQTRFRNASGLPDWEQVTTARDMATLGRRLFTDFPNRYHYFGTVHFAWGRAQIRNHNRMLGDYDGADGIKTGFINASGFNIVTSAQRDGVRLVGATFGGSSWVERDRHMGVLLDQGFSRMGVAPRAPSSVMAAAAPAPRRNAPAARPVAQGNTRAAQVAPQQRPRPQQQVAAAPNRQNAAPVAFRQTPAAPPPRPAARPAQRVEQGSAGSNPQRANTPRPDTQRQQTANAAPRPTQR
ncbi:MAG: D-alanyl-D-alanine carboxypeptidase [Roseomonas sp.]|nr:D-alanyl-D-alanine carboxypeptidase [Roseomonas sp.]MCA3431078.1 D-alanyl-D-alanine carboxypeptidase [Roseomonas sp.]MCA3432387.1 D-alanyl-D-alanine carboxypeptidase [Roseomonas sp.]